ncbi:MAG: type III pantothenate kinase [candidate division WOR-3 bacterium]|nr:type III pantothenate kinase [candidate division WOR-3 bacterium]MCX7947045.1 type III pantothenate kinase [candidate division WOR-3 bacterium]
MGNSLIKCGIVSSGDLIKFNTFSLVEISKIQEFFHEIEEIAYCSVLKEINLSEVLKNKSLYELNYESSLVKLNYSKTLGSDRIAKAHYISYKLGEISIVVDFGTATVIDIVDSEFKGGFILLGYKNYLKCLHESTSLLPNLENTCFDIQEKPIANSTEEAILLGLLNSYKSLILKLEKEFNVKHKFITGGNANLFLKFFKDYKYEPHMTLSGLYLWLVNFKSKR